MQPYFFPYIGYFQLIAAVDKFVIYDDVNYIKRGWINRNNILVNNQSFLFSIPLISASQNSKINEIKISEDVNWKSKLLKTIELSYKKAPYYQSVFTVLEKVLKGNHEFISQLNTEVIIEVCNYLKIDSKIQVTSTIYGNSNLKGSDRLIDICRIENAKTYINAIGGEKLYNKDVFKQFGIDLFFLNVKPVTYKQYKNDFIPNLSIIDVLMFNDVDFVKELLIKINEDG